MNQKPKHTKPSPNSYAAACGHEYSYEDFEFKNMEELMQQDNDEEDLYFYHGDHLGSSSWITDGSGNVNQHLAYMPFGESFIDQRNSHDIRFKFTGKERDGETGFDYFGARYYSSDISVWLSVDPLSDLYPSTSPYMYVLGNPVRYTDPDGRWVKGAGIVRNLLKTDNRINAENDAAKHGVKAEKVNGEWTVSYNEGVSKRINNVTFEGTVSVYKIFNKKKKTSSGELFFKVGGDITFGLQLGAGLKINDTKLAVEGNIASVTLAEGSITQTGNDTEDWEPEGDFIGKKGEMKITQGLSIIGGYEHSFKTKGHGFISGTETHSFNLGPLVTNNNGRSSIKIGVGAAVILGVKIYIEFGIK